MLQFSKILVPTDLSECSKTAVPYAAGLARLHDARLILVYFALTRHLAQRHGWELEELRESLEPLRCEAAIEDGVADPGIVEYARREGVDLIVMATHARSGMAHLLGSISEVVVRHAPCPVMVVRHDTHPEGAPRHILVPVSLTAESQAVVPYAAELASALGASMELLHVIEGGLHAPASPRHLDGLVRARVSDVTQRLSWLARSIHQKYDVKCGTLLWFGHPHRGIVKVAEEHDIDLIILATHAYTGLTHMLMGSTAESVLRHAPCPVLTVRMAVAPTLAGA